MFKISSTTHTGTGILTHYRQQTVIVRTILQPWTKYGTVRALVKVQFILIILII